jgi:hypothetical protein
MDGFTSDRIDARFPSAANEMRHISGCWTKHYSLLCSHDASKRSIIACEVSIHNSLTSISLQLGFEHSAYPGKN